MKKNIVTYWKVLDEHSGLDPASKGILSIEDPFGNNANITDGSPLYDFIDNLHWNSGRISAEQIFEKFASLKNLSSDVSFNTYRARKYASSDFEQENDVPFPVFYNLQYGEGGNLSKNEEYDMLSFESTYNITGNNKYYISNDVYLRTVAYGYSQQRNAYRTDIHLCLDPVTPYNQIKVVQVKYDIKEIDDEDIAIDILLKELSVDLDPV